MKTFLKNFNFFCNKQIVSKFSHKIDGFFKIKIKNSAKRGEFLNKILIFSVVDVKDAKRALAAVAGDYAACNALLNMFENVF